MHVAIYHAGIQVIFQFLLDLSLQFASNSFPRFEADSSTSASVLFLMDLTQYDQAAEPPQVYIGCFKDREWDFRIHNDRALFASFSFDPVANNLSYWTHAHTNGQLQIHATRTSHRVISATAFSGWALLPHGVTRCAEEHTPLAMARRVPKALRVVLDIEVRGQHFVAWRNHSKEYSVRRVPPALQVTRMTSLRDLGLPVGRLTTEGVMWIRSARAHFDAGVPVELPAFLLAVVTFMRRSSSEGDALPSNQHAVSNGRDQ